MARSKEATVESLLIKHACTNSDWCGDEDGFIPTARCIPGSQVRAVRRQGIRKISVDAIGVTVGARAWDFLANLVEVWGKVPASVKEALEEEDHHLEDGQDSVKDLLIDQEHMDKFMTEDKLYGVWNNKNSKLTVSPLGVSVWLCMRV
jgi:hypothetical protein